MTFYGSGTPWSAGPALFILSYLACSLWGLRIYRRRSVAAGDDAFQASLLPVLCLTLTLLFAHKVSDSVFYNENWMRLQKTFYLWSEGELYLPADRGPILNALYGPGTALAYSAAVLFKEPHTAMYAAAASAMLFFFVPVALLFATTEDARRRPLSAVAMFGAFAMITFFVPSLRNAAFRVHADAPMLGLSALSCFFLVRGRRSGRTRWMWASAFSATWAVWTKQVALPLLPALVVFLWITDGPRAALRHLMRTAVTLVLVSAAVLVCVDREAMWFQMVTVPRLHPWELGKDFHPKVVISFVREWAMAAGIAALWVRALPGQGLRQALSSKTWAMLLFVGVCMLPAAVIGRLKVGGSINTLSHCSYFLFAAAFAGYLERADRPPVVLFRRLAAPDLLIAILLASQIISLDHKLFVQSPRPDYAGTAFRYLKAHPGKTYFPRLALIHFLAEGRHYNDPAAIRDRAWAGLPVPEGLQRVFVPPEAEQLAYYERSEIDAAWLHYKELEGFLEDPELPHFRIYRIKRPAGIPPPAK